MSTRTDSGGEDPIIESRDQLIALFERGEKPPEKWKIGTEHEKFVYARKDHHAPSYPEEGDRKSTRLNSVTNAHLVCRLLLEKKKTVYSKHTYTNQQTACIQAARGNKHLLYNLH